MIPGSEFWLARTTYLSELDNWFSLFFHFFVRCLGLTIGGVLRRTILVRYPATMMPRYGALAKGMLIYERQGQGPTTVRRPPRAYVLMSHYFLFLFSCACWEDGNGHGVLQTET
ncbi:hypothetical protein M440DRAFT_1108047 [Trichoderma longibrachiatum ATCC 18648]|uniref:Uncharacterized protein n=1 Tax=Trichoderma longibrachiatum ATCC 18648 TaxID=983965 RepID=A0A2T4CEJ3_TRILO|nr:hypothetical protein M440DRAFT_1108047 [Trichoderma longibrachiatum ATCC 18648]